jgi:prepilin signal peptidase PulO-like enzyme (type II secretory pathway)
MSDRPHDEKEEEKEEEKKHEKSEKENESWEEKWRRDPVGSIVGALVLIWFGLVFLASNLGVLRSLYELLPPRVDLLEDVPLMDAWPYAVLGAGVLVLLGVVVRLLVPAYRRPVGGDLVFGFILLGVGLGWWIGWEIVGPAVIIAIGAGLLLGGLLRKK